jgi:hypothetical protein
LIPFSCSLYFFGAFYYSTIFLTSDSSSLFTVLCLFISFGLFSFMFFLQFRERFFVSFGHSGWEYGVLGNIWIYTHYLQFNKEGLTFASTFYFSSHVITSISLVFVRRMKPTINRQSKPPQGLSLSLSLSLSLYFIHSLPPLPSAFASSAPSSGSSSTPPPNINRMSKPVLAPVAYPSCTIDHSHSISSSSSFPFSSFHSPPPPYCLTFSVFFISSLSAAFAAELDRLRCVCVRPYREQASLFLNSYWDILGQGQAEVIWDIVTHCIYIDPLREKGNSLQFPDAAAELFRRVGDVDGIRNLIPYLVSCSVLVEGDALPVMPLCFYLIYRYRVNWKEMNASEGDEEEKEARRVVGLATDKAFLCQLAADKAFEVSLFLSITLSLSLFSLNLSLSLFHLPYLSLKQSFSCKILPSFF